MTKITIIIVTCLVALIVSYVVHVLHDRNVEGFYVAAALPLVGVAVTVTVGLATVLAFRATMVAWITVLVLLAFAGNRRKVLVRRGGRITGDVAWYLVSVMFRSQNGLFALACATVVSLLATYR